MRPYFLAFILTIIASAQGTARAVDVAGDVARVRAMRRVRDGVKILEKAVRYCDSVAPSDDACAEAYDWYGMVLQVDHAPETLRKVEPLYRRALELRQDNPGLNKPGSMALSLELEAMAITLIDSADAARGRPMQARARELRAASVNALEAKPVEPSSMPPLVTPPDPVYKPGGGVVPPRVNSKIEPEYSQEASLLNYSGTVLLSLVVDASGRARSIRIFRGLGFGLDEKAAAAVQHWVFLPGMKDGSPVSVTATIEVSFRIL